MAKGRNNAANKPRTASAKAKKVHNQVEIIDEYPKEVPYSNPPGMQFVRAEITDADGNTEESIICIGLDQLNRIKKGK